MTRCAGDGGTNQAIINADIIEQRECQRGVRRAAVVEIGDHQPDAPFQVGGPFLGVFTVERIVVDAVIDGSQDERIARTVAFERDLDGSQLAIAAAAHGVRVDFQRSGNPLESQRAGWLGARTIQSARGRADVERREQSLQVQIEIRIAVVVSRLVAAAKVGFFILAAA